MATVFLSSRHPGETILPEFIHDEAWSVRKVLNGDTENKSKSQQWDWKSSLQEEVPSYFSEIHEENRISKGVWGHTAGCWAGWWWHLCRFWELAETVPHLSPSLTFVFVPKVYSEETIKNIQHTKNSKSLSLLFRTWIQIVCSLTLVMKVRTWISGRLMQNSKLNLNYALFNLTPLFFTILTAKEF